MEEIKNEATNVETEGAESEETSKKDKKQVKSFKMSATQKQRVDELLSKIEGSTESEKLLEVLELTIERNEMTSLPPKLEDTFKGDREKITDAIRIINSTFESITIHTSKVIEETENKLNETHKSEVNELLSKQEGLEDQIKLLRNLASEAQEECEEAKKNEEQMKKEVESIRSDMELKDKVVEALTKQLEEAKDEMTQIKAECKANVDELKEQITKKDTEIAELVTDSRKYKEKIEKLEAKNEELANKSTEGQQEIQRLTGQLSIHEVNLKNEQAKNEDLKAQIAQLQAELTEERKSKGDLQSELIKMMTQITQQSSQSQLKEEVQSQPKANSKAKYILEDQKGKKIWEGNMKELIERANKQQQEIKVTTKTDISTIEDIFAPLNLIVK